MWNTACFRWQNRLCDVPTVICLSVVVLHLYLDLWSNEKHCFIHYFHSESTSIYQIYVKQLLTQHLGLQILQNPSAWICLKELASLTRSFSGGQYIGEQPTVNTRKHLMHGHQEKRRRHPGDQRPWRKEPSAVQQRDVMNHCSIDGKC